MSLERRFERILFWETERRGALCRPFSQVRGCVPCLYVWFTACAKAPPSNKSWLLPTGEVFA